jgi:E3 ubiquitin-protein ligase RFWD2
MEDESGTVVPAPTQDKLQNLRLNAHLPDLQQMYFQWRLKTPGAISKNELPKEHQTFSSVLNRCSNFSSFRTLASLHYGDNFFNFASSIVSSIEIDKDDEFFATAGVTKKIKIYDLNAVLESKETKSGFINASRIHEYADVANSFDHSIPKYPIREMSCQSKVSCMSWNSYIKPYLVSSDYEGIVALWDTSVGACILRLDEHEKRAWSVDFSELNPTQIASGGDDSKVKLWSTNQRYSVGTIETKANVCSVKFHPTNGNHIAFGSADHHVHYYDLRMMDTPLKVYQGHKKAVSYVKFLNSKELVSASTDCSLRLWSVDDSLRCVRTFTGHTNEKNFVGLSVNSTGEFISCGSETNQVFAYYSQITKPIATHRFGNSIDAITVFFTNYRAMK